MKGTAPGKFVLVGAYAVLEGAPAIVVAVDRLATADASVRGPGVTAELCAAFPSGDAPLVDLSRFSAAHGKLGLGGSAAALVAALVATGETDPWRVFRRARRLHREVQGGGSGIDVAASVFGGIHVFRLSPKGFDEDPTVTPVRLPPGLHVRLYAVAKSARTSDLLGRVAELKLHTNNVYSTHMRALAAASSEALAAAQRGAAASFREACDSFAVGLRALGEASGAPIFLPEVNALFELARESHATFYPSGAGGGDLAVYVGEGPPPAAFEERATTFGLLHLDVSLGASPAQALR